jgi:hypothetical protein
VNIDDTYLNTVFFICRDEDINGSMRRVPRATGFFVTLPASKDTSYIYAVTARHCIQEAGQSFYIRVNTKQGYCDLPSEADGWFLSDTDDVAVAPFRASAVPDVAYSAIPLDQFVDEDFRYQGGPFSSVVRSIGGIELRVGHELFFLGLFIQHAGQERNLPIARFGHIARMPVEPVAIRRTDGTIERLLGYLAECRSWGGHSGSPAFFIYPGVQIVGVNAPPNTPFTGTIPISRQVEVIGFVGLVSAHFDIPTKAHTAGDVLGTVTTEVNSGIAVITPSDAIRTLLLREDVVEEREERDKKAKAEESAGSFDIAGSGGAT